MQARHSISIGTNEQLMEHLPTKNEASPMYEFDFNNVICRDGSRIEKQWLWQTPKRPGWMGSRDLATIPRCQRLPDTAMDDGGCL